jgi:hypothetical protein
MASRRDNLGSRSPQYGFVISAQAGIHIPETVVMGPRFRGDDSRVIELDCVLHLSTNEMAGREPGHHVKRVVVCGARYVCWIAESSQWPPRTRMKVQISVASSGPPWVTRPLSRSMV